MNLKEGWRDFGWFNAEAKADVVTLIWIAVFVLWVWATLHRFLVEGSYELPDLPTGVAAVLVAVPLTKVIGEAVRARKPD